MYALVTKYLATAYLDADDVRPGGKLIGELTEVFHDELLPTTVREQSKREIKSRVGFVSENGEWRLVIVGDRLALTRTPINETGDNMGDLASFCESAKKWIPPCLDYLSRKSSRLSVVQQGLRPNVAEGDMINIATRLLNLPSGFASSPPHEWDFRAISQMERKFGDVTEVMNNILVVKRVHGTFFQHTIDTTAPQGEFDRIYLEIEVNTLPDNTSKRFSPNQCEEFYTTAAEWHDELGKEILGHMSNG